MSAARTSAHDDMEHDMLRSHAQSLGNQLGVVGQHVDRLEQSFTEFARRTDDRLARMEQQMALLLDALGVTP